MKRVVLKHSPNRKSGQALVEFALVAPFLVLLMLAIVSFGLYINANLTVQAAARIGARSALIGYPVGCPGDPSSTSTVYGQVDAQISQGFGLSVNDSSSTPRVLLDPPPTIVSGTNQDIVVNVRYLYRPIIPLPGLLPSVLTLNQSYTVLSQGPYPPRSSTCASGASQENGREPATDPPSDNP